jgi:hypothetical protein
MNTYIMTVTVVQTGKTPADAKATLEQNLGTVINNPRDFEVSPIMVEVPRARFRNTEIRDGG